MEGKAIGINSIILSSTGGNIGIGFAIPSNMARKVMTDLKKEGRVIRGYLGVNIIDILDREAEEYDMDRGGVIISSVEPDSPAEKAGIKKWDVVIRINGEDVKTASKLQTMVANLSPGDSLELTIVRGNEKKKLTAVVREAPDTIKVRPGGDSGITVDLGMVLMDNSPAIARRYELDTSEGIIVKEVKRGSNAQQNGIRGMDIILRVNRLEIESISQFRDFISSRKAGSRVLMVINRGGTEFLARYKLSE